MKAYVIFLKKTVFLHYLGKKTKTLWSEVDHFEGLFFVVSSMFFNIKRRSGSIIMKDLESVF